MEPSAERMPRDKAYLGASLVFAGITAALLAIVKYLSVQSAIGQVSAILAGMSAMGALTYFQTFVQGNGRRWGANRRDIGFSEDHLYSSIKWAVKETSHQGEIKQNGQQSSQNEAWALPAEQLVGRDNALALARLRIELETELRRIADQVGVGTPDRLYRTYDDRELALVFQQGHLPEEILRPLRELIYVCNSAVHGADVPNELALSVTRIGNQLLEKLRTLPDKEFRQR